MPLLSSVALIIQKPTRQIIGMPARLNEDLRRARLESREKSALYQSQILSRIVAESASSRLRNGSSIIPRSREIPQCQRAAGPKYSPPALVLQRQRRLILSIRQS